jgi:hypothetical protein
MKRPKSLTLAIIVCLCTAGLLKGPALGVSILMPPSFKLAGRTAPSKLPETRSKPLTLTVQGKIVYPGGAAELNALETLFFNSTGTAPFPPRALPRALSVTSNVR